MSEKLTREIRPADRRDVHAALAAIAHQINVLSWHLTQIRGSGAAAEIGAWIVDISKAIARLKK